MVSPLFKLMARLDGYTHPLQEMTDVPKLRSGLDFIFHVYKNVDGKARHGARIKVFPGRPRAGNETEIRLPKVGAPFVPHKLTISGRDLAKIFQFLETNREAIWKYWDDDVFSSDEMYALLVPYSKPSNET
jgi:hypothetical protein